MTADTLDRPALRKPPGPKGLPVLGNLLDMGRDPFAFLEKCAENYGSVASLRLGGFPAMLLNDLLIEQVLVKDHQSYTKNKVFWRQLKALMGDGIFTLEGEAWRRQRKISAPAFATKPLQGYALHMVDLAEQVMEPWRDGQVFDLHKGCMDLSLRVAARTLLNTDVEEDLASMDQATNWINDEVVARFSRPVVIPDSVPLPGHIRYRRGVEMIDKTIYRIIDEYRAGRGNPESFVARLMGASDEEGVPLTDKQLRDEIINMLMAGYETTALNISWAFHLLGQHRDYQDAMAAEVRSVVGDRKLTNDDLANLPLVERAVIEILRLYPPAWAFAREAAVDTSVGDFAVPKGTTVVISSWVTHRSAKYFDDPLAFRPERWTAEFRREAPRFAYYPFGGGPRICIGNRFAMMEAMFMLATIVRKFDIERLTDRPVKPVGSVTLRPKGGVWVKLHERG